MEKIYKVVERSLYFKSNKREVLFLVKGNKQKIKELCSKMGQYKTSAVRNFYDAEIVEIEKTKENENLTNKTIYEYEVYKTQNGFNVDDCETKGYILSNEQQMQEMKNYFEQDRSGLNDFEKLEVVYKKADILTVSQAYQKFNNMMKEFNSSFYVDENEEFVK